MSFFGALFGSGKSNATQPTAAVGLSVQTSVQGQPIPITYGTTRVAGNLIWYGNFTATQQQSSGGSGKGSLTGGGGKGGGSGSYTYSTSFELALGEGPMPNGIWNVYYDKTLTTVSNLGMSYFDGAYEQGPWPYLFQGQGAVSETHTVPATPPYTITVNAGNEFYQDAGVINNSATVYTNETASYNTGVPLTTGQYALILTSFSGATYVFSPADIGKSVVITVDTASIAGVVVWDAIIPNSSQPSVLVPVGNVYYTDGGVVAAQFTAVTGAPGNNQYSSAVGGVYTFNSAQASASVTINYYEWTGSNALGYSGIAYLAAANYALGNNPQMPNFNFELAGIFSNVVSQEAIGEQYTISSALDPYQYWYTTRFAAEFISDGGVVDQDGNVFDFNTGVGPGQYDISNGAYIFNPADAGTIVNITYTASVGPDADPSSVVVDLLTNPHYGVGYPSSRIGTINLATETHSVPGSGPYTVTVTNAANFTNNLSVQDSSGTIYTPISGTPAAGQYAYNKATGVYTFNSAQHGVSMSISYTWLSGLTLFQAYCIANGLLISPNYDTQQQCASMFDDFQTALNSGWVWSSGVLTMVPYGDQSITANGYTYTAPTTPLFNLTDDFFLPNTNSTGGNSGGNDDPVMMTRTRPSDAFNSIKLEWLDRGNNYNPAIIEAKNQAAINTFGLRQDNTRSFHMFCNGAAARMSVQLQLQRQMIRNIYYFTLDQTYVLLDPMDIVTLTDSYLGLNQQPVRITEITENDDGTLSFVAEEYLQGVGSAPAYSYQRALSYNANYNTPPGNINTPVVFVPPPQITAADNLEVWCAVSGVDSATWGGCNVYLSQDGETYSQIGVINGPSRQGVLSSGFSAGTATPDITNVAPVNISESQGQMLSTSQTSAAAYNSLCYVAGSTAQTYELFSYEDALLTGSGEYSLSVLYRGAYGTTNGSHTTGQQFARLDDSIFSFTYDKSQIGNTVYLKFASFNQYGGGQQALSSVTAYPFVVVGPPVPVAVTGFQAQQSGNVVVFGWVDIVTDIGLKGYDIAYGAIGSLWANKTLLTEAARGTEITSAAVPPGTWEFSIRAHDIADQLGPETLLELVVTNQNDIISQVMQETGWFGTLVNFVLHYTGVLIPANQYLASAYTPIGSPATVNLGTTVGGALGLYTAYVKITYVDSDGNETTPSTEHSQAVPAGYLLTVGTGSNPTSAPTYAVGFNVYAASSSGAEVLQNGSISIPFGTTWTEAGTGLVTGTASPPSSDRTGFEVFNDFVPDPVSSASYTAPTVDTGYNDNLRVYASEAAVEGPGQTGTPTLGLSIDTWLTGQSDPNVYTPWTVGYIDLRYLNARLTYTGITSGSVAYITDFTPTIDTAPVIENNSAGGITVSSLIVTTGTTNGTTTLSSISSLVGVTAGMAIIGANIPSNTTVISVGVSSVVMSNAATGSSVGQGVDFATWVVFPTPYHSLPGVVVTPQSSTAASGSATNITVNGFTPLIWNSSGNSISGTASWQSTGE